jgi:hypothetical protein
LLKKNNEIPVSTSSLTVKAIKTAELCYFYLSNNSIESSVNTFNPTIILGLQDSKTKTVILKKGKNDNAKQKPEARAQG